jgi:hypothetical protein
MNLTSYKNYLSSRGTTLGQVKRTQSDVVMNNTFTLDPTYKRVYILTKDGWKWEDAKYQFHSAPSISKDAVDYYLQFRPKVHYPVGSYVIVPDDTSPEINLDASKGEFDNPFSQPIEKRTQIWIIVGRDDANAYVRYMILKCDWEFRWVYKGKLMTCWACSKNANSYTAGVWADELSRSLDNLTSAFIPDVYYVYGNKLEELGLCDTRTIFYGQRFFMSNNTLDPKIYQVTKVTDINPQGIVKLSIKQDDFNEKRDNIELLVCDYYTDEGDITINVPNTSSDVNKTSSINWMSIDDNGELVHSTETELNIGKTYYFGVTFSDNNIDPQWRVSLIGDYSEEDKEYYVGLMKLTKFDASTLALKPAKASSLKGKRFALSVSNTNGEYYSSIEVEVAE